jgi:tetratricopeptide (TPR) repeat protein
MYVDLSELAKSFVNVPNRNVIHQQSPRWAGNMPQTAKYNRDFLVGYLLHSCRLYQQISKPGSIPVLQTLLEVEPENGEVHYLLARQYEMIGNLEAALESFECAAALRPDKPTFTLAGARVACFMGRREKGLAMVCSIISAYPDMVEAYAERALIYETDENWRRALDDYQMCGRLEPLNPAFATAEARMYRLQKQYKMARRCASRALKIDPTFNPAHEELRLLPFFDQFSDFFHAEAKVPS